ncbi:pro-sigmaK processing inhibitor BofA family protein [Heliophilum fasciatum]|uniref:Inhibitor of the pro-sigma K processing machinery n=1 Tax=Heliophilum fasciatum TaxID=35700 RepID=A0A4R2S7W6_9FIRM|nr:pro-sigmaK processing inhibitor BofA family protein [Heliophilum fasciatum]MCW2276973.1 inhibitor of the pro-sigma K processing machinery [Heliophilum fasciatum]TCP68501.1 inhibitor of the pro-sigma K processing machinery [Heliophilum fasciatum]
MTSEAMVVTGLAGLALLAAIHFFWRPLRWLFVVAFRSLFGLLILGGTNVLGGLAGLSLPLNPVSALIAGFLGLPGLTLLILLKYWIFA